MKTIYERLTKEEYLELIESLAKEVVSAAITEDKFEVFADGIKTDLQHKITDLARHLRYRHEHDDGCLHEDPRKTGLKKGLRQLDIEQLNRVIDYPDEMVLDTLNYEDGKFCPLAVGLNLHQTMEQPSHDKVFQTLSELGYKIYNTRGIKGEFYTNNRKEDLIQAAREVLQEKLENKQT